MTAHLPALRIQHHIHELAGLSPDARATLARALLPEARHRHHHRDVDSLARSLMGPPGTAGRIHVLAAGPVPLAWLVERRLWKERGRSRVLLLSLEPGMRPGARQHARLARLMASAALRARLRGGAWLAVRATWPEAYAWGRHLLPTAWPGSGGEPPPEAWAARDAFVHGLGVLAPLAGRGFVCAAPARVRPERPATEGAPEAAAFDRMTAPGRSKSGLGGLGVLLVARLTWRTVAGAWWAARAAPPLDAGARSPAAVSAPSPAPMGAPRRQTDAEIEAVPMRLG